MIQHSADDGDIHFALGIITLFNQGRYSEAATAYQQAIRLNPDSDYSLLGNALVGIMAQ
ncbi:MAG: tetratricopeptide repeat protein [Cyanobacteria bacterium J06642_11]